uniref:Putative RNA-dependent RNA polymerase n=1 Tax=Magnaporthe oryzae narnavirus 1 TaxID=2737030 RepID=A0A6M5QXG9_9VIRU|nr:putative RNA-dependent RNA polymerase [Magnaporthe oryzae narnavirus 1]QPF16727.1 RNA-dependent RNA polymerase [Magnaporthe oryzae narnavirus 2]
MSALSSSDGVWSDPSTHEESLSALSSHGGRKFSTAYSRYVIHTATIPLATTLDQGFLIADEDCESYFHGYQAGEKQDIHCPVRSCMFIRPDKTRGRERLRRNCPCGDVALENGSMKPLCFLVYVRSLNRNLVGWEQDDHPPEVISPEEVMFCQNSTGVFDNSYPGFFRDKIGVTGWGHVTEKTIVQALRGLYWYRKYNYQYKLDAQMRGLIARLGFRKTKHIVMQSMHTINSLLVKKMLAFAPEIEGYEPLAKHTAWAFRELMEVYGMAPQWNAGGQMVEPEEGFYQDAKNFSNFVKANFHKEDRLTRLSITEWRASTKAFGAFFGSELKRLRAYAESLYSNSGSDYSLSPAWIFRMTTLCQTRGLGYLPDAIAQCRRSAFRATVNRQPEPLNPEMMHLQALAVKKRLSAGIPPMILSEERIHSLPDEEKEIFQDAFSRIAMPIKGSASLDTFVKDGGKIEDARQLLKLASENQWKIPVRDLNTHEIREYLSVSREPEEMEDVSRPLFWISYQLFLNHWIRRGQWKEESEYHRFPTQVGEYQPDIMNAKIVHISEPGKERNLTKSHATYAWFLTPGAKLSQAILAVLPEHRAGLLESGHEWRHQKRISPLSDESGFVYDSRTGKVYPEIRHVFKDWTESTDFISKSVGYVHLRTFFDYVAFPAAYGRLILKTIVEPQPVVEVVSHVAFDDGDDIEPVEWTGSINEGFMMGNPITKTILHLVHESEHAVATLYLARRGLKFVPNYKFGMPFDRARLDRNMPTEHSRLYLSSRTGRAHLPVGGQP